MAEIRRLRADEAEALVALRAEALVEEPLAFGSSPTDERARSLEFVRTALSDEHEQAVVAAFVDDALIGMVGVVRGSTVKERHKAHIWGMYVRRTAQGHGIGRALLRAAVAHARTWPDVERVQLSVTSASKAAHALYESEGFRTWGTERRALAWKGRFVDELHLVLELRDCPGESDVGSS
jgi:RimJ/RimL family protein N-acetyltransferase